MGIRLYDSLQRAVVDLRTREEGRVKMYCCGPTVYNYIHIGNARTLAWFDFIRRYLVYRGYDVTYVMNYTDVDDKIIERAAVEGITPDAIAAKYTRAFEDDMAALGVTKPDIAPRATDHISEMIQMIESLIRRGCAYEVDGDVFFAVERFDGYGRLSGRSLDDMRAGERVEPHPGKRHPLDFALWKSAKEGELSWPSPWGPGRPGWHIECSVMSTKYLGMSFDIHGGGTDLIFPHHENELAQAEAATEEGPFVMHWLHSGMVQMDAEKMSKSLGNVVVAHEAVQKFDPEAIRFWFLTSTYRGQPVYSEAVLEDAHNSYSRWKTFDEVSRKVLGDDAPTAAAPVVRPIREPIDDSDVAAFVESLDDDFNSAGAFTVIHDLVRRGNKQIDAAQHGDAEAREQLARSLGAFAEMTSVLGFTFPPGAGASELVGGLIDYLIELREAARSEKAFDRADGIRDRLTQLGVALEDTPEGTRWRLGG